MQWLARVVRAPPGLRDGADRWSSLVVGIVGYFRARRRPVPQDRLPGRRRDHAARRRRARGGRDRDHRQDRGGGQHHQRHRRAALDLRRGRLAGLHHLRAREERRRRRAGGARQGQRRRCRSCPGASTRRSSTSSTPTRSPILYIARERRSAAGARDHRDRRQAWCGARSRASPASARSSSSAGASGRSTCWLDPVKLRAAGAHARGGAARDRRAEPHHARRPRRDRPRRSSRCACSGRVDERAERCGQHRACARRATPSASATWPRVEDGEEEAETVALLERRAAPCCSRCASSRAPTPSQVVDARAASASTSVRAARCRRATSSRSCATTRGHPHRRRRGQGAPGPRRGPRGARRAALPRQPALSTVIAAIAIPISIIGTFALMWVAGLHAQQHHAAGAGAGGRHRHRRRHRRAGEHLPLHRREGLQAVPGGGRGDQEIGLAVLATTLSLIAVFLPIAFMAGIVGRFLAQLRPHDGVRDRGVAARQLHAHADAGGALARRPDASRGSTASRCSSAIVDVFYRPIERVYMALLRWVDAPPLGRSCWRRVAGARLGAGRSCKAVAEGLPARRRSRRSSRSTCARPRARSLAATALDRRAHRAADPRRSPG